jgi:hypothetical protein
VVVEEVVAAVHHSPDRLVAILEEAVVAIQSHQVVAEVVVVAVLLVVALLVAVLDLERLHLLGRLVNLPVVDLVARVVLEAPTHYRYQHRHLQLAHTPMRPIRSTRTATDAWRIGGTKGVVWMEQWEFDVSENGSMNSDHSAACCSNPRLQSV